MYYINIHKNDIVNTYSATNTADILLQWFSLWVQRCYHEFAMDTQIRSLLDAILCRYPEYRIAEVEHSMDYMTLYSNNDGHYHEVNMPLKLEEIATFYQLYPDLSAWNDVWRNITIEDADWNLIRRILIDDTLSTMTTIMTVYDICMDNTYDNEYELQ